MRPHAIQFPPYIAHRGARAATKENTMAAFKAAEAQGSLMFECDVQLTSDSIPIIFHDDTLDRLTTGHGCVAETSWKEMDALNADIPTLAELLIWFQSSAMLMNLELKYPNSPQPSALSCHSREGGDPALALVTRVSTAILALPIETQDRILLSSFNLDALLLARQQLPHIAISLLIDPQGLITWPLPKIKEILEEVTAYSIHCDKVLLHQAELREAFMAMTPRVLAYTVNTIEEAYFLFQHGISSVFSDCLR